MPKEILLAGDKPEEDLPGCKTELVVVNTPRIFFLYVHQSYFFNKT